jgi:hypothetical protein
MYVITIRLVRKSKMEDCHGLVITRPQEPSYLLKLPPVCAKHVMLLSYIAFPMLSRLFDLPALLTLS